MGGGEGKRKGKYLITVWETSHMLLLPSDFSVAHFLALLTTEVAKRKDWCSGLRKRSPGGVEYFRPATVQ